jgi:ectoine hydroxylase-related dioxygenase (phytanoyl-CoA dioxygenase family)
MNDHTMKRKLQIGNQIPHADRAAGLGYQHFYDAERIHSINRDKSNINAEGSLGADDLRVLYKQIYNVLTCNSYVHYPELVGDSAWGEDQVFLGGGAAAADVNLLERTEFNDAGFCIVEMEKHYSDFMVSMLRDEIRKTCGCIIPDNMGQYHNALSDDEQMAVLNSMPFKRKSSPEVNSFCEYLEGAVSDCIGHRVKIFNDDVWFRICRPTAAHPDDFNPCHRDIYLDFYRNIVNIYVPVVGSDERSSLLVQPGSHLWNEKETRITSGGAHFKTTTGKKYSVDAIVASKRPLQMVRPNPANGQMMIFSPYLIHGCASNESPDTTRISMEVRFIRDDDAGRSQEAAFNDFLSRRDWR